MPRSRRERMAILLAFALASSACGRKSGSSESPSPSSPAPAPAPPSAPAEPTPPSETDAKAAAVRAALDEQAIASDPKGQWATTARASSTFASDKTPEATSSYSAAMATGAPNVERYSDDGNSWATELADQGIEWLEVGFARPVQATALRVRLNYAPGAIIKLELIDEGGSSHEIWSGVDGQAYAPNTIAWFSRTFEKTSYRAVGAKITLASNAVPGWNEIDAIQLVGE